MNEYRFLFDIYFKRNRVISNLRWDFSRSSAHSFHNFIIYESKDVHDNDNDDVGSVFVIIIIIIMIIIMYELYFIHHHHVIIIIIIMLSLFYILHFKLIITLPYYARSIVR